MFWVVRIEFRGTIEGGTSAAGLLGSSEQSLWICKSRERQELLMQVRSMVRGGIRWREVAIYCSVGQDNAVSDEDVTGSHLLTTMFMDNFSSSILFLMKLVRHMTSDILSEVHDHDHYQDVVCEHHKAHEMHDDVQPNCIVDSDTDYTGDSNMILFNYHVGELGQVVQIVLWYLDSGCSNIGRGWSCLGICVKNFIGTVRFGNDHFGAIMVYGDYVIGDSVISKGLVPNPVPEHSYVPRIPNKEKSIDFILHTHMHISKYPPYHLALQSPSSQQDVAAGSTIIEDNPFAHVDNDPFVNVFAPEPSLKLLSIWEMLVSAESNHELNHIIILGKLEQGSHGFGYDIGNLSRWRPPENNCNDALCHARLRFTNLIEFSMKISTTDPDCVMSSSSQVDIQSFCLMRYDDVLN
ncbi:hypothetical protein Tco_0790072 [Tanacetum coccineum]